jgi:allantoicase
MHDIATPAAFAGLVDLADERLGGKALTASDEFFAPKENLLKPGPAHFDPDRYTDLGKWMDGWESRRKRVAGHDWCIVRLGLAGVVQGVDIDTSHFLGNHPPYASLEGGVFEDDRAAQASGASWQALVERSPLAPGSHNLIPAARTGEWTHVRLHIYPDGGVARLRVFGTVSPDWRRLASRGRVDAAALPAGGTVGRGERHVLRLQGEPDRAVAG